MERIVASRGRVEGVSGFPQSICNEVYGETPLRDVCRSIRKIGYAGIEIAPFTLSEDPARIPAAVRSEYRDILISEGIRFVGLHWLMVAPKGLHVTAPDPALRAKSWQHILDLVDLCADLGDGGVMVFGSPQQRATMGGLSREQATRNFTYGLAGIALHAAERGVTVLVEALPANQCDVINTLAEAARVVHEIGSPAIQTMFDTHNAADETEPHAVLIDRYFDLISHVHVNETDGRYPGTGDYDFASVFRVLRKRGYQGWISLEVFDFQPDPETIARESFRRLEKEFKIA